jgi:hypothetical protein
MVLMMEHANRGPFPRTATNSLLAAVVNRDEESGVILEELSVRVLVATPTEQHLCLRQAGLS